MGAGVGRSAVGGDCRETGGVNEAAVGQWEGNLHQDFFRKLTNQRLPTAPWYKHKSLEPSPGNNCFDVVGPRVESIEGLVTLLVGSTDDLAPEA